MGQQRGTSQGRAALITGVMGGVVLLIAIVLGARLLALHQHDVGADRIAVEPSPVDTVDSAGKDQASTPKNTKDDPARKPPAASGLPVAKQGLKSAKPSPLPPSSNIASAKRPGSQFLTGPADGEPIAIARNYLKAKKTELGLGDAEIDEVLITDQYASRQSGVTHIYLRQQHRGLEVINANININVTKDGSIMNMGNTFVPDLAEAIRATDPELTPLDATTTAINSLNLKPEQPFSVVATIGGASRETIVSASGVSQKDIPVHLEYYAEPNGEVVLVWALDIYTTDSLHYWQMKVDAVTGDLVGKFDQVVNENYTVYAAPLNNPAAGSRTIEVNPYTNAPSLASPYGWHDTNGVAGAEFTITRGNNVHAYEDSSDTGASLGNEPDGGAGLVFNFPVDITLQPSTYTDAAVVNLFYWNNLLHDIHYEYGFDEASGNFQVNNYGNGGTGGDDVHAEAQDGSGVNNANMLTLVDGTSPRMQMYLAYYTFPTRDGSFDNEVIIHEYGHGISKRLTGGPNNVDVLFFDQSGGMGEGWGDFWALALTAKASDINTQARPIATWLLGQAPDGPGIRQYPYSTDMTVNPHTYEDIDGVSVPHGVGSIWCAALWEMYWNLVDAHGFDPDFYDGTGGNNIALQLVMDGLKLQSATPTFLDARDAILLADEVNNAGANYLLIWQAFAKRGMGLSADDGGTQNTLNVTEAFDVPDILHVTPTQAYSITGPEGGPFMPISVVFQLTNEGTNLIPCIISKSSNWLDLSQTNAFVPTNGLVDVTVSVNASANTLPRGIYNMDVSFLNLLNDVTQTRQFQFEIGAEFFFAEPLNTQPFPSWQGVGQTDRFSFGQPLGLDGDPSSGFTGTNVFGNNLEGLFWSPHDRYLTTTAIDCSDYSNVEFTFQRWLGAEAFGLRPWLDVSNDGVDWTTYWQQDITVNRDDGAWKQVSYDISGVADGKSTVYLRWAMGRVYGGLGEPGSSYPSYGWNIDDISLKGIPLPPLPADHFEWDPIAPVQHVEGAISVRVTARDINEDTVSGYSSLVNISGLTNTFTEAFGDDFQDGNFNGWSTVSGSYTRQVSFTQGRLSFTQTGGGSGHKSGVYQNLPNLTPLSIEFYIRSDSEQKADAFFVVSDGTSDAISFYTAQGGQMGVHHGSTFYSTSYNDGQWYKIAFTIDWAGQELDYYVDDALIASDIPFKNTVSSMTRVDLYNLDNSQAWWDDITFIEAAVGSTPLLISPTTSVQVTNGTWSGLVTIHQEASDAFLRVDDGNGLIDDSVVFDVIDEGTIGARNEVLYFDISFFKHGNTALQNLGFDITTVTESTPFQNMLNSGAWDFVVVDSRISMPLTMALDVADYVAAGGRMLIQYNDLDGSSGSSAATVLASAFGVASVTDFSSPLDVYPWDAGHPIFNTPNSVGILPPTGADLITDNGDRVEPAFIGATALAGFVSTTSSGQGAIILANDGRTLFNAFLADDMSNVVELLENEILFLVGGNPPNVLLISDTHELTGVAPFLAADGHSVTRITNEFANGSANLTNLNFLQTFDMVIWGASGNGSGNLHDPAVHNNLENYIQAGGHLLVTGGDTLASPVDTNMANLVRSTTATDIGATSFTTAFVDHFILNGPAGDFRNTTVTPGYTNWDGATADISAGAISLASVDDQSFDAIIYTDILAGGSVGYWTGGDPGALPSDGMTDWKTLGDSLDILRNWVFGLLGARTDLALSMISSSERTHLWQPVTYTVSVHNNGPNEATGVRVTDTFPTKVLLGSIQSSQGSYSNAGNVVLFDLGTLPSGGSATITLDLAPFTYGAIMNRASVVSDQYDTAGFNNDALKISTVIPGVDGDFDGIHDWWEFGYHSFLETMDATTDLDGDEMTDLEEWIALSDAEDSSSIFAINADKDTTGQFVLYWDSAPGREYDIYWSASLFDSFQPLKIDIPFPRNSYTDTVHFAEEKSFYRGGVHLEGENIATVGYYDFSHGAGLNEQSASILAAGHTPFYVTIDQSSFDFLLTNVLDVLYVQNSFSASNSAEYLSEITTIQAAVSNGLSLIIHDRAGVILGTTPIMPGGESIPLVYEPSGDINVVINDKHITDGVAGMLDDTTLDSATHSALGYALESSLPDGAIPILSQTDPTHISTFAYPYGEGWVIYSTILLDFYLGGGGSVPAFANIYAPNIVDYGVFLTHENP